MEDQELTQAGLARGLGITRARVTQMLNVLKLPKVVKQRVRMLGDPMTKRLVTERSMRKVR